MKDLILPMIAAETADTDMVLLEMLSPSLDFLQWENTHYIISLSALICER